MPSLRDLPRGGFTPCGIVEQSASRRRETYQQGTISQPHEVERLLGSERYTLDTLQTVWVAAPADGRDGVTAPPQPP
jgi:hypothetical protein